MSQICDYYIHIVVKHSQETSVFIATILLLSNSVKVDFYFIYTTKNAEDVETTCKSQLYTVNAV